MRRWSRLQRSGLDGWRCSRSTPALCGGSQNHRGQRLRRRQLAFCAVWRLAARNPATLLVAGWFDEDPSSKISHGGPLDVGG
jgi:hypothetical protein